MKIYIPPVRKLPTHPKTCAVCGATDWLVVMTERDGRTVHVRCSSLASAPATPKGKGTGP
jgi:hypothetical protein